MANNTAVFYTIPNDVLLASVVFKFIALIIGVLGNVTVITHAIFFNKEKTATSYLVGNLAMADLLVCLTFYPIWIVQFIQIILNVDKNQDLFCKFSRSTMYALMFASIATLLAITVDRYLYIVKPLRYPQIVTHRRVFLAVSGIWITTCCPFIVQYIHSVSNRLQNACDIPVNIGQFTFAFVGYIPLTFIFILNFRIFCVAQKQRKRIMAETTIASVDNSTEESANRMSFVLGFFVALKAAKTFAIVVAVLTICVLTPSVIGPIVDVICFQRCKQIWFLVFTMNFTESTQL